MKLIRKTPSTTLKDIFPFTPYKRLPEPFQSTNVHFTMNGRNAIYQVLKSWNIDKSSTVLLPAYHCTALVDPFIEYGVKIKFYNINKDLSVNMSEVEPLIDRDVTVLLYVHFFGFPAPVKQFAELGKKYSISIIEDCTHTLYSKIDNQFMGTFGDASVFSFRKVLSVQDGGALILKKKKNVSIEEAPLLYNIRMLKWILENPKWNELSSSEIENRTSQFDENKKVENAYSKKGPDSQEDSKFFIEYANWSSSIFSKWIFRHTSGEKIFNKRRENYLYLESKLKQLKDIKPCFVDLPEGVCPLGYPFIFEHEIRLDYCLRERGIPAFSFGENLNRQVDINKFGDAYFLSNNLILLPVHHQLKKKQMDQMFDSVKEVLKKIHITV